MSHLVQTSQINRKHIIDPLNHLTLGPVGPFMLDKNLIVVLHSGTTDIHDIS